MLFFIDDSSLCEYTLTEIFQVIMENQAGTRPIPRTQSGGLISFSRIASFVFHPLLATNFFYFLAYTFFISHYNFPLLFQILLLGSCSAIVVVFVINFFYKVSIHTTAAGILPGFCITLMLNDSLVIVLPLLLALLIAAAVGIIRWLLGAHTMGQILLGYTVGILTQLAAFFYLNT